jgi:4-hydroxymandelate oxidase
MRRGTDVLKALALAARAVAIGRPWFWGLAVGGFDIMREELDVALAMCGQSSVQALDPGILDVPTWWLSARVARPLP